MKRYYTHTIPLTLCDKLVKKGMPELLETYAQVFDWLMGKGFQILLFIQNDGRNFSCDADIWSFKIGFTKLERKGTWHEAADAAIEKALELIK